MERIDSIKAEDGKVWIRQGEYGIWHEYDENTHPEYSDIARIVFENNRIYHIRIIFNPVTK